MNTKQRNCIKKIIEELDEMILDEQEKYDNAPENLQDTPQIDRYMENAEIMQEAVDLLEDLVRE